MPRPSKPVPARRLVVDPLPNSVLHKLVADLPGPRNETEAARAARFEAQLAEVLSYNPRNPAEAMLATHCIMLRLVADDARRDASHARGHPEMARQHQRSAKQCDQRVAANRRMLADFQSRPLRSLDPATFAALGLTDFLIPDPTQSTDDAEEAFSAIIVPLHPAPNTLQ
ncbi:MAG TPA: hypothetical protein VHX39_10340 [Acetobacteraceae bacterium]|nr:hypothetical protein [Acetobacteraceae bacterium]